MKKIIYSLVMLAQIIGLAIVSCPPETYWILTACGLLVIAGLGVLAWMVSKAEWVDENENSIPDPETPEVVQNQIIYG